MKRGTIPQSLGHMVAVNMDNWKFFFHLQKKKQKKKQQ